jgi:hypothetical protein
MMVTEYVASPNPATVERLATMLDRSKKSIIGKLSREGVYRREVYVTKTGEKPITKLEIVEDIAAALEVEVQQLSGLEKAPKTVLKLLSEAVLR